MMEIEVEKGYGSEDEYLLTIEGYEIFLTKEEIEELKKKIESVLNEN